MNAGDLLLRDASDALSRDVRDLGGRNDIEEAFAAWVLAPSDDGIAMAGPAGAAARRVGAERSYRDAAILGFAANCGPLPPDQAAALESNLILVAGRAPRVNGAPMPFCSDGIGLLGIALGASRALPHIKESLRKWAEQFLNETYKMRALDNWQKCLVAVAQREFAASPELLVPQDRECADARTALRAKGLLPPEDKEESTDAAETITATRSPSGASLSGIRAALRLAALRWVTRSAPTILPGRVSDTAVADMLRGVPAALGRWVWESAPRTGRGQARQWHIDHEYHVQSLLFSVLRPVFPDLTDEENTPQVGRLNPRADLGIPSLRLIIEAKFWKAGVTAKKMVEEIAADSNLYLVDGSRYSKVLPFVWDDVNRSDEHDLFLRGLRQLRGVADAVIVSRPARFSL